MLSSIQKDLLTEILNVNIGKAASSLSEMANQKIILNTLIGEFGNLLDVKLEFSFPDVEFAIVNTVENSDLSEDMHFLTMFTSFLLSESKAKGMIFVALSTDSETMLIDKINEMLVEINE
ncbi:MAG TPA: hypothetical protein DEP23_15095 [Ruminococcaceae bacterium]|nr:hypothetical protein [Oscillospiraceae bacterium]